jgi:putative ABC transport system permease protein
MNNKRIHPYALALWFIRLICPKHLLEEIEGDLIQKFRRDVVLYGATKAKIKLIWNTIRFTRPGIILRNKFSTEAIAGTTLINYFSIAFRTIRRNQMYSALNIVGLALGMAAFLFILQYVTYEKSYDKFHANHRGLYRIAYSYSHFKNNETSISATTPPRIAPFMKEMMPQVKAFARARPFPGLVISYNNRKFRQDKVLMVDPDFLKIFSFPLTSGDTETALKEIRTVVISERAAEKYFGDQPALGKIIGIDGNENFRITGVAKDVPENSHLKFDFLISYETIKWWSEGEAETSWWHNDYYGYVLLDPTADVAFFNQRFAKAFERERGKTNRGAGHTQEFYLQPVTDIHLYSKLANEPEPDQQGDSEAVFFLTIIAFFVLLIAWINYINLFTARAMERAKEVGVRKTIGALQSQLIGQFMVESFVMNFLAIIIAIAIVSLGLSYFKILTNSKLSLDFLIEFTFWKNMTIFLLIGSLVAGLYPAFVLSSHRPAAVLKGKLSTSRSGITIRRSLVVFQFVASVTLISGTMIVYLQLNHMKTSDLGFDMTELIVIRGPGVTEDELTPIYEKHTATFVNELLKYPEIKSVTGGNTVPGEEILDGGLIKKYEDPISASKFVKGAWIGYDYFSTLGIDVLAGRSFAREFTDDTLSVVLNASAVKTLGFSSPEEAIGHKISLATGKIWTLIGVVDDFNQMSVHSDVNPMFFSLYTTYSPLYIVKFEKGSHQWLIGKIKKEYEKFFPRDPYDYFFLDEFFNKQYHKEQRFSYVFTLFASFAIVVSCLGLFGLSSFTTLQRTKEIGIRKILGANLINITFLLSKEFIMLVGLANVMAWPLIYFVMDDWLSNFASRIKVSPIVFLVSGFLVVFVAIVTVSYKTIATANADPVKALRYE